MSNRTWVQIICRRDDLATLLAIPSWSDFSEEHKLRPVPSCSFLPLTRLVYSEMSTAIAARCALAECAVPPPGESL